jgi:hypothetical protein
LVEGSIYKLLSPHFVGPTYEQVITLLGGRDHVVGFTLIIFMYFPLYFTYTFKFLLLVVGLCCLYFGYVLFTVFRPHV